AAFVTHGLLQLVANGWRAILHRKFVRWDIVAWYGLASVLAGVAVSLLRFTPSKPLLFLLLGLVPFLTWLPQSWIKLDAAKPSQAFLSGLSVTGLNLTAGVAGPLLDIFFVRTELTRHAIVATKAATQVFAHLAKVLVYGAPLLASGTKGLPAVWVFALAIPLSMLGTVAGGRILDRMSDVNFKRWTRWIVTAVGISYLVQAAQLMLAR
ncbi:MAG TPA: TSUP family transporter, partial [Phenylobacterium sp.]|nr:TSUP family transporter [Phenylobacterium sp.]